jgi:pyruvate dehydrogenase E2 component (dihydrolipoamide acetyltransferase)
MEIRLPQLAEGVDSATVVNILVSEGDRIQKDQSIMELETQKAVGSVPSPESGTVAKVHVKQGEEVAVGQPLISLVEEGAAEVAETEKSGENGAAEPARRPEGDRVARQEAERPREERPRQDFRYESKSGVPPPASPSIRKMAANLGIDLSRVEGSERGGRITLRDIRSYIERLQEIALEPRRPAPPAAKPARETVDFSKWGPVHRERLSPLRRTVGKRMLESWSTIPHITQFGEADVTALLRLKKRYAAAPEKASVTVTAFILKAVLQALKKYPAFNSSLDETTEEIVYKDYYHFGIAVDTEAGLIVPVIKNVDKKGLLDLSRELADLTRKARERKVSLEELRGGTFTISNQGALGGGHFTPIIYKPQVAILGLGRSSPRPVARAAGIETAMILPLAVSYDHRVIDGADAVRFTLELAGALENFDESALD